MTLQTLLGRAALAGAIGLPALLVTPGAAQAQAGRLFLAVPIDSNLVIGTFNGTRSNTWVDESLRDKGTTSRSQTGSLLYSRIMDVFGHTGGPGISIPYSGLLSVDKQTG